MLCTDRFLIPPCAFFRTSGYKRPPARGFAHPLARTGASPSSEHCAGNSGSASRHRSVTGSNVHAESTSAVGRGDQDPGHGEKANVRSGPQDY